MKGKKKWRWPLKVIPDALEQELISGRSTAEKGSGEGAATTEGATESPPGPRPSMPQEAADLHSPAFAESRVCTPGRGHGLRKGLQA